MPETKTAVKEPSSFSLSGFPESEKSLSRINAPLEPQDPDERFQELIRIIRQYHPSDDVSQVERAYEVAKEAHGDQKRHSGEPYITHPVEVAIILAELEMDKETIIAALLHDVVEDTGKTLDEVRKEFGDEVAELVDGVTKLTQIKYSADKIEVQAENLRKMFLAMAKDIRVIIIKLADRLHNMRTLQYMTREKQKEKAKETMDIYAPIAQRLGISKIKIELDDLALKYSEPDVYYNLVENIKIRRSAREDFIERMVKEIRSHMEKAEIECEIDGRVKHFFSIYKKMINQNRSLDQIYDLFAIRIKVETVKDCYAALGIIHEIYKPIPGRFKDYIAMPKPNMYQSLHTTLISPTGEPFEVQIRTYEMHRTAEYGIAAHWKYKEGKGVNDKTIKQSEEEKLAWLRQILDWQNEMSDNKEFMEFLKSDLDLFSDSVFCFTPDGDVKNLPVGSTPIDFAYSIHSAVGNKMIGARVNDKIVTIDYKIQNGDRVEIITSQNSKGPSMDWLNIVKSPGAKQKINQWFRTALKEENIVKGKELVEKYMKTKGIDNMEIFEPQYQAPVLTRYSCKDWDSMLAAIGHGGLKESQVVNRLLDEYNRKNKKNQITDEEILESASSGQKETSEMKHRNGIVVKGIHDVAVRFAKCCSPVPGDEIVGFVTRGRGVTVHRTDCINIVNLSSMERERLIDAQWDKPSSAFKEEKYLVEISIFARNRIGMLVDISKIMSEKNLDVTNMNVRINKQQIATIDMGFKVSSTDELSKVIEKLHAIDGVIDIIRTRA
ncbi:MAG: bifunctional (p)ppGpp synthetase/guanosine-3',5'-bis(diphosphate) 3'-pyrophosphohydrolase [Lachnospiraceae bacterium]|nr:bifunctional (p)ppGpp synthetase/guanosine-3',5'-bis(diphosphate) 3'-pyrophosphohydrolase [Lachnospiraceae bacterium]MBR7076915.1 bifunctional (p)ppGpp synthetase/guanosine-3',5'-bis(diphosphate) 3'-pyrophosphohydrolase [Lachnospiraceae bacterium]